MKVVGILFVSVHVFFFKKGKPCQRGWKKSSDQYLWKSAASKLQRRGRWRRWFNLDLKRWFQFFFEQLLSHYMGQNLSSVQIFTTDRNIKGRLMFIQSQVCS